MTTTTRRRNLAAPAAITAGLLAGGLLVWHSSYAAFTATTDSKDNSFAAGTVVLSDDDNGQVLFTSANLVPDQVKTECIAVTYEGSAAADITLAVQYGAGALPENPLAPYLSITVAQIGLGDACDATATVSSLLTSTPTTLQQLVADTVATPLGSWHPAAGAAHETRRYRITAQVADTNAAQGKSATANFVWTAKSVVTP